MFRIECETTVKTIQHNNERKQCICHIVFILYLLYTVDTKFTERHINDKNEQKEHIKNYRKTQTVLFSIGLNSDTVQSHRTARHIPERSSFLVFANSMLVRGGARLLDKYKIEKSRGGKQNNTFYLFNNCPSTCQ